MSRIVRCFRGVLPSRLMWITIVFASFVSGAGAADPGMTLRAVHAYQQGDRDAAIRDLLHLAYQGDVAAQFNLGVINREQPGSGVVPGESVFWFRRGAEAGDVGAQFNLAMLLFESSPADIGEEVIYWLERSADAGYGPARVNLGILLLEGYGVPADAETGRQWLQQAARMGDVLAQDLIKGVEAGQTPSGLSARLYPLDLELRTGVRNDGNGISSENTPVYALPSGRQEPLLFLDAGESVDMVRRREGWVHVRLKEGLPAWMSAESVGISGQWAEIRVQEAGLWIAPGDDPDNYRLGMALQGERLPVLERAAAWVRVRAPMRFAGWVRQENLDLRVDTVRSGVLADKASVRQMSPPAANPDPDPDPEPDFYAAGDTVVYQGHGSGAVPVGRLIERAEVARDGETDHRARLIHRSELYGWVHGSLVTREGNTGSVQTNGSRVRLDPDTARENIVGARQRGETLEIIGESGGWLRVRLDPVDGWVDGESVTR